MGARCTFVFKTDEDHAVALYSHWGEDSLYSDLAAALNHARPRWQDSSYGTRMAISYLIQHNILEYRDWETDRKSTRLNSSHLKLSRMPSSA